MNKNIELFDKTFDYLLEKRIATISEITLVTAIKGWNLEALNAILYVRTGYRSIDKIKNE